MTAITSSAPASVSDPAAGRASGSAPAGTRFSESRLIPNTASMARSEEHTSELQSR